MNEIQLTKQGKDTLEKFVFFSRHMVVSKDIDPLYPMLRWLQRDMDLEQSLWHSFLYVAWYNLPSSTVAFDLCPEPNYSIIKKVKDIGRHLPTGVERRASRGGKVLGHIAYYLDEVDSYGSQKRFYAEGLNLKARTLKECEDNWRILNSRLQTIHMNGRWAAYKHCEVLRRVNKLPVIAPDMGNQFSSGPREGLAYLYPEIQGQDAEAIRKLDLQGLHLQKQVRDLDLNLDIEELETVLCNWKSLNKGKYYVGHDIDENQEQIYTAEDQGHLNTKQARLLTESRKQTLPRHYLGEIGGWMGVQKHRMSAYKNTGEVLIRE